MPQNPKSLSNQPDIYCPECQYRLSPDLATALLKGTTVYCERCGFAFIGIDQKGEVKDFSTETQFKDRDKESIAKLKYQWSVWRKQWHEMKKQFRDQFREQFRTPNYQSQNNSNENVTWSAPQPPRPPPIPNPNFVPNRPGSSIPHQAQAYISNANNILYYRTKAEELYRAVCVLSTVSVVVYIFSLIGIITSMIVNMVLGDISFLPLIGTLLFAVYIIRIDINQFIPQIRSKTLQHGGLAMLVLGAVTTPIYGLGILLIIRGVLYLIYTSLLLKTNSSPVLDPNKITLHSALITQELAEATRPYLGGLIFYSYIVTVLKAASNQLGYPLAASITLGILSGIFMLITLGQLSNLRSRSLNSISQEETIRFLIFGMIISLFGGSGAILIAFAIVMLVYLDSRKKINEPLLSLNEYLGNIQPFASQPFGYTSYPPKPSIPTTIQVLNKPNPSTIKSIRYRRFDPETGKPYPEPIPEEISNDQVQSSDSEHPVPQAIKPENNYPIDPSKIFTTLDPEVYHSLIELQLSDDEKADLAKNLLYLAKREQLKYIQALKEANQDAPIEMQQNIARIQNLALSDKEREMLIHQLEYMPIQKQNEFVSFIEASVKNHSPS